MQPAVAAVFTQFQTRFEGCLPFLYLDVRGLVTTAIGLLVDSSPDEDSSPWRPALPLPWQVSGYVATQQEIVDAWNAVKAHQEMKLEGGGAFGGLTTLRLTPAGIDQVTLQKAAEMEEVLRRYFPSYDDVPCDAQLGLLSMSWALGPAFSPGWPMFSAAFKDGDWNGCAEQCQLSTVGNPGVGPRNIATAALFRAAASGADPDAVHWTP
jgi:GH24 family phage-related lysozyme (muramidase)